MLGGGGLAGIGWETGILRGIADAAPATAQALLESDVVLGTSAGATVGAQLGSGAGLDALFDRQVAAPSGELRPDVNLDDITPLFLAAVTHPDTSTVARLQRIGAVALTAATVAEPVRRAVIERRLPSHQWPAGVLRIPAVDADTGELTVFDRESGVGLVDAVAASSAVPGAWPPATIGGRRYLDGGVASCVNLAAARDCDVAVVLVPAGASAPAPFGAGVADEIAAFPGLTLGVFADDASLAAFGVNPLDPACRAPAARAGREQGRRIAGGVTEFLNAGHRSRPAAPDGQRAPATTDATATPRRR